MSTKHPNADLPKEQLFLATKMFLPNDGHDWDQIIQGRIEWLTWKAQQDSYGDGDAYAWRACDPVSLAILCIEIQTDYKYHAVTCRKWLERLYSLRTNAPGPVVDLKNADNTVGSPNSLQGERSGADILFLNGNGRRGGQ